MKRTLTVAVAALAILAFPASALAADTRIDKLNEHVGLLVPTGPTTWTVQDLDYKRIATVQRTNARRFDFLRESKPVGSVRRVTATTWRVYKGETLIGEVRRAGSRTAIASHDGGPVGRGEGKDSIPAAASVLFSFRGATGVPKHDHGKHRHEPH